jgi:hypothetical protein
MVQYPWQRLTTGTQLRLLDFGNNYALTCFFIPG